MKLLKNNKKYLYVALAIIVIATVTVICIFVINSKKDKATPINPDNTSNNSTDKQISVNGKLLAFLEGLKDNYYIKYSGKFENTKGEMIQTIVEYSKKGSKYALKSNELNMHIVYDGNRLYSISHTYKLIVTMHEQNFSCNKYNLAADIGQSFVKNDREVVNSKQYDVQEYSFAGVSIRYYFLADDLKMIKYNDNLIKVLRVEKTPYNELFNIPTNYEMLNA